MRRQCFHGRDEQPGWLGGRRHSRRARPACQRTGVRPRTCARHLAAAARCGPCRVATGPSEGKEGGVKKWAGPEGKGEG